MQYGYRIIDDLLLGMKAYMKERGISRLDELVGEELPNFVLPNALDRQTIVYPKAISFDSTTRQPRIIGKNCVGCHLCRLVCPTGAIGATKRIEKKKK